MKRGDVNLWLVDYATLQDEGVLSSYRSLLSADERKQESRFYFPKDRLRYLITRASIRVLLSRYLPVAPSDWLFSSNGYGRPIIANECCRDSGVTFNISHTHSLIVVGLSRECEIGVDVENVVARRAPVEIADRYFAPAEVNELAALAPSMQQNRFFEYWTLKESYIKARGMGLSIPLDKFEFTLDSERRIGFRIERELGDDPSCWRFWQFRPATQYLVSLCAARLDCMQTVTVSHWLPTLSERVVAPMFVRESH